LPTEVSNSKLSWNLSIINPIDKTKLSCYISHRRSTTVSLKLISFFLRIDFAIKKTIDKKLRRFHPVFDLNRSHFEVREKKKIKKNKKNTGMDEVKKGTKTILNNEFYSVEALIFFRLLLPIA